MFWVLYLLFGVTVLLLFLAFLYQDYTFAWFSGMLMLVIGVWIVINGLNGNINWLTHGFGASIFGLGVYFFIRTSLELIRGDKIG